MIEKLANPISESQARTNILLWALMLSYAVSRVFQVVHNTVPMTIVVALHVLPPAIFALFHGAARYRFRGMLAFCALGLVVGNTIENIGVATGIPFGRYYLTDLMGPKLFHVPILLGMAYLGMGYLSWTLADVILGGGQKTFTGLRVITVPLLAGCVMLSWDLAMDPVWSTVMHAWIWLQGGAYFGVPLSNFAGWYITVYIFYQLFAVYLRHGSATPEPLPSGHWGFAVLFYAVSAAGNLILLIPQSGASVVSDPAGTQWKVSHIVGACALVSIFIMGGFALLAWTKSANRQSTVNQRALPQTQF